MHAIKPRLGFLSGASLEFDGVTLWIALAERTFERIDHAVGRPNCQQIPVAALREQLLPFLTILGLVRVIEDGGDYGQGQVLDLYALHQLQIDFVSLQAELTAMQD